MVDAGQGVEAQSVATCYTAIDQGLEVIPVLNKMDLSSGARKGPYGDRGNYGLDATDAVCVSAKTGMGVIRPRGYHCQSPSPRG